MKSIQTNEPPARPWQATEKSVLDDVKNSECHPGLHAGLRQPK